MANRKLKLKGAARYTITTLQKDPILRNGVVTVDDATADKLLKETVRDRANNAWPIWVDVTNEEAQAKVDEEVVKPKRRRRAPKKQTAADESAAA